MYEFERESDIGKCLITVYVSKSVFISVDDKILTDFYSKQPDLGRRKFIMYIAAVYSVKGHLDEI